MIRTRLPRIGCIHLIQKAAFLRRIGPGPVDKLEHILLKIRRIAMGIGNSGGFQDTNYCKEQKTNHNQSHEPMGYLQVQLMAFF
jgi:hypothetical protein